MLQTTDPNQWIPADLFGPLVASEQKKKHILTITDAFAKFIKLVAISDKEATTVAETLFEKWFWSYGVPLEIVMDLEEKESCVKVSDDLISNLGTKHLNTTPHHPQCDSKAEVFY